MHHILHADSLEHGHAGAHSGTSEYSFVVGAVHRGDSPETKFMSEAHSVGNISSHFQSNYQRSSFKNRVGLTISTP